MTIEIKSKWYFFPLLFLLSTICPGQSIPTLRAQTLADAPVDLPAELHGKVGVLVLGFSKKSSLQTRQWNDLLLRDLGHQPRIVYYQAAVLTDVPALMRGIVLKGIRSSMPAVERAHFVPILKDAAEWKQAAALASPDEAYVLLTDGAGKIIWRTHGAPTSEVYGSMKDLLASIQSGK